MLSTAPATTPKACTCGPNGRFDAQVVVVCADCQKCGGLASQQQQRDVQEIVNRELLGHNLPLAAFLSAGDGVLDIGANKGDKTRIFASRVGPTGFVLAVEPDPMVAEQCRTACADLAHVEVRQVAVGAVAGVATLHRDASDSRRSSLCHANIMRSDGERVDVQMRTVDHLAAVRPGLRGIKIDAQGSEVAILRGATETLKRRDLVWHVEFWPVGLRNAGTSAGDLVALFMHAGYVPVMGNWWRVLEWAKYAKGHQHLDLVLWHNPPASA